MPQVIRVADLSNREFFARYARAGRIGLVGGTELINRLIARAQRHLDDKQDWSLWSHAFVFEGQRQDGQHWVIESDLDFHRKHIRLGLQENRVEKYFSDDDYGTAAVLDFGLTEEQVNRVIGAALELVASRVRYSLRELAGTLWAMRHPEARPHENRLAQESAFFCSAFVGHVFRRAGVAIAPGVAEKHTTPEDLFRSVAEHTQWLLIRKRPASRARAVVQRIRAGLKRGDG